MRAFGRSAVVKQQRTGAPHALMCRISVLPAAHRYLFIHFDPLERCSHEKEKRE